MATYDDPYMFNIVLNSLQASDFSTPFNNDSTYLFNWTNIPQGRYSVSFSYKGANNGDFIANDSPQIFISFGNFGTTYQAGSIDGSYVSNFLGNLRAETHAAGQVYFYANINDNPDIFLTSRPTDTQIRVQIFRTDFLTPFTTLTGNVDIADYVLTLQFKRISS